MWISIKERLPKEYETVIVSDGKYIGIGYWTGKVWSIWRCGRNVTHWQPKPELPFSDPLEDE